MIPEPFNSLALVVLGSVLGALASGMWCGCLPRWRWRRSQSHAARSEQRARDLARRAGSEVSK